MCVWERKRKREKECVCVCVWEIERKREREREKECVCVFERHMSVRKKRTLLWYLRAAVSVRLHAGWQRRLLRVGPVNPAGWRLVIRFGVKRGARAGPEGSDEARVRGPEVTAASVRRVSGTGVPAWPALVSRWCCFDSFTSSNFIFHSARGPTRGNPYLARGLQNNDATRAFSQWAARGATSIQTSGPYLVSAPPPQLRVGPPGAPEPRTPGEGALRRDGGAIKSRGGRGWDSSLPNPPAPPGAAAFLGPALPLVC